MVKENCLENQGLIKKTKSTLFLANILQEPFIALNLMLDVILSTHFGASALQISILTTLRPVLAVFAFYWGSILLFRPELLRFSLVFATLFATALFLFAPFANSIWYFIAAEACFILFWRAANPAQMEILKLNVNVGNGVREKLFSQALSLSFASGIIIGPLLGLYLKFNPNEWKLLFFVTASLYSASALLKSRFHIPAAIEKSMTNASYSLKEVIVRPWQDSLRLLKNNRSFFDFQLGFFIAGSGLMFAKPSIPGFLTGQNLSFLEIFSLFTLLEGIGFICTSTMWAKTLSKVGIHTTSCFVALFFAAQPLLLIGSFAWPHAVFCAYLFYGAAQAGSRLVWNLSGSMLCGNEPSSQYTSVNILAIGVRGSFVPLFGGLFAQAFGSQAALFVSFIFLICGALFLLRASKKVPAYNVAA